MCQEVIIRLHDEDIAKLAWAVREASAVGKGRSDYGKYKHETYKSIQDELENNKPKN